MPDFQLLFHQIFESYYAWAHLPYLLFVLSTLMRNIIWLRSIAIVAGLVRIFIRAQVIYDPVTVLWETVLVAINIGQLGLIWWDNRRSEHTEDEHHLVATIAPQISPRIARLLLGAAQWRAVEPGEVLMTEGEPVGRLVFVADGAARVERENKQVAVCIRGDLLGEMSFVMGGGASATVVAERPMRIAEFDATRLRGLIDRYSELRQAFEASLNRNLIGKLGRAAPLGPQMG